MANDNLRLWITHNLVYRINDFDLDAIYKGWLGYCHDCGLEDKDIMEKASMKKRLAELAAEGNPIIAHRGIGDAMRYRKIEARPEPIETNSVLSDLGKRVMKAWSKRTKVVNKWS